MMDVGTSLWQTTVPIMGSARDVVGLADDLTEQIAALQRRVSDVLERL